MKDYFWTVVYVIAISKRIQWALIMGLVFFLGISLTGSYMTENLHLTGIFKGLEDTLSQSILAKYDKAALFSLFSLFSFWSLAFKFYCRDKNRL